MLISVLAIAQEVHLKGKIQDHSNSPLTFFKVLLFQRDNNLRYSTFVDSLGNFDVIAEKGSYRLNIRQLDTLLYSKEIALSGNLDLGTIWIKSAMTLNEVNVYASKPLIDRRIDRLIYNLENSSAAQGMDGLEALSMVPMLQVTDNADLRIVGKGSVSVMINGKLLPLRDSELLNYIRSLRSDNISKVEIITAPPAKYDAEGNSGLINIVLKKNPNMGFSGTLNGTYIQRSTIGFSTNSTLNFQSERLSFTTILGYDQERSRPNERQHVIGSPITIEQVNDRRDLRSGFGGNVNVNYKINEASNVGFIYDFRPRDTKMDISSSAGYYTGGALDSTLWTETFTKRSARPHVANVFYDLNIDTLGKKLSVSGNFLSNDRTDPVNFTTIDSETQNTRSVRSQSDVTYGIWSGQADLEMPLGFIQLDLGAKFSNISNELDLSYYNKIGDEYILDAGRANVFDYSERIYASYLSAKKTFGKNWEGIAGLRYEYSNMNTSSPQSGEITDNSYSSFFPSLFISYTAENKGVYSLNYTKRINRPDFQSLNPYRWYTNLYNYNTGNPLLSPSFNHNFEVSYSKNNLATYGYWQHESNGFDNVVLLDGITNYTTVQNFFNQDSWGLYATYSIAITRWWDCLLVSDMSYRESKSFIPEFLGQNGWSFYYNTQNTIYLNQPKTLKFIASFWHNLPRRVNNIHWKSSSNLSAGINYSVLDNRIQLAVNAYDLLRTNKSIGEMYNLGYTRYYNNYYDIRRVVFSLTYNIGQKKIRGSRRRSDFDENQRAN